MSYSANDPILGKGTVTAAGIQQFFVERGKTAAPQFAPDGKYKAPPADIGEIIRELANQYGVNADMMAAQIGHESAWWQSAIVRAKNNPSGLGATNDAPMENAITFPSAWYGIRATVAHLLSYTLGDESPLVQHSLRHEILRNAGYLGIATLWRDLNGRWAWPGETYAQSIAARANDLVSFAEQRGEIDEEDPMSAQIPGFKWHPAARTHYSRGRARKITGFAIHYTAGTNSLDWLTHTSSPPVSSTFLIKNKPTLDDRGWQLVAIEDTPWTTGNANSFTVSSEYEHTGGPVSDAAYEVMAQTVIDTAAYVEANSRGAIPLNRQGVKGHKEWVGGGTVCPDGISVDRIVDEIKKRQKPEPPKPDVSRYFPETGHYIAHGFKSYWEAHDNPAQHGLPISEEFDRDGVTVQYFERARYEWQPDIANNPQGVVLGRIGAESIKELREKYPDAFERQDPPE
jgi:hypothetical protein